MPSPAYGLFELTINDGRTVERVQYQFAGLLSALDDLSKPMEEIGLGLHNDNWENFAENGALFAGRVGQKVTDTDYTEWAPLRPLTIIDRVRRGYGQGPTLVRTNLLRASLTRRGAPGNIFEVTKDSVKVGTRIPYAQYHHFGTRKMSARVLVGFTQQRRTAARRAIADYLHHRMREVGLHE